MNTPKKWKKFFPLFFTVFIDSIGIGIILPIFTPLFFESNTLIVNSFAHAREILFSLTLGVYPLAMFFSTPILGAYSDQRGRKKVLLFCLTGIAFSYFLSMLALLVHSVLLMIISRLISGFCSGSMATAQAAILDITPVEEKAKYLSLLSFPVSLGFIIGPLLSALLTNTDWVAWFGFWTPLLAAGILSLSNILFLTYGFQETYAPASQKANINLKIMLKRLIKAFQEQDLGRLCNILFLFELAYFLYFQYIALFMLARFHYNAAWIGYYIAFLAVGFAFTFLFCVPYLSRRYKSLPLAQGGMILNTIFLFICAIVPFSSGVWIATFFIALGNGLAYSTILSLFSDFVSKDRQGWIMGVTASITALAFFITGFSNSLIKLIDIHLPLYLASGFVGLAAYLSFSFNKKILPK